MLLLKNFRTVGRYTLFKRHSRHIVALLHLTRQAFRFIRFTSVLLRHLQITISRRARNRNTRPRRILARFTSYCRTKRPIIVSLVKLHTRIQRLRRNGHTRAGRRRHRRTGPSNHTQNSVRTSGTRYSNSFQVGLRRPYDKLL